MDINPQTKLYLYIGINPWPYLATQIEKTCFVPHLGLNLTNFYLNVFKDNINDNKTDKYTVTHLGYSSEAARESFL
jgi:hypothetical protein